jgi:pimeloyl-ACP methyl ester carboxylesterase
MLSLRSLLADEPEAEHPSQIGPHVLFDLATRDHDGFDIVFVHGLRGSSFGTWSKNGVCWPRDLLKEDTKEASLDARVITWGYDASIANVFTYASQESIFGHAETLLGDLARLRIGKVFKYVFPSNFRFLHRETGARLLTQHIQNRPIIFLGHSLGGLVIKEALIKSAAYQSHGRHPTLGEIYVHTKGVIFLGTPHRGSNKESLGEVIAHVAKYSFRQPNDQLMRTLQHDSHILENQRDQFTTISEYIHVVCIREEIPTAFGMVRKTC